MKINVYSSNTEIMKELGRRIKAARIAMPATQQEIADRTNLSLKTISNIETGKDVSMSTFLDVMRELRLLTALDIMIPEQVLRPSEIAKLGKQRERASRKQIIDHDSATAWKWGDEA